MASASAVDEWPKLVKNIIISQNKDKAVILGIQLYLWEKPYQISLDGNYIFFNSSTYSYVPVYSAICHDKTDIWSIFIENAWEKVHENYLKTDGDYLVSTINPLLEFQHLYTHLLELHQP